MNALSIAHSSETEDHHSLSFFEQKRSVLGHPTQGPISDLVRVH